MPWISSRACPVPPSLLGWVLPFFGAAGAPVALPGEQVRVTAQGTVPRGWLSCLWLSAHPDPPQGQPRVGDPMCSSTAATSLCHRRGCPQPGGHCWEYPGLCLQDFHRAGPQNLHAPSRSPPNLGCSRFCSQAVPASPRHWNFVLSAFPQCHLPDVAFRQGMNGHTRVLRLSSPAGSGSLHLSRGLLGAGRCVWL